MLAELLLVLALYPAPKKQETKPPQPPVTAYGVPQVDPSGACVQFDERLWIYVGQHDKIIGVGETCAAAKEDWDHTPPRPRKYPYTI